MSEFNIKVDLPDFRRQLRRLSIRLQDRVIRKALLATSKFLRQAVKQYAPKGKTGTLKRAIYRAAGRKSSTFRRDQQRHFVSVRAGEQFQAGAGRSKTNRDAFYWEWVHEGKTNRDGRTRSRKRPFFTQAFVNKRRSALVVFNAAMNRFIKQAER